MPKSVNRYSIVPTIDEHILDLAPRMIKADKNEAWAAAHLSPEQALLISVKASYDTKTALVDGKVVYIFLTSLGRQSLMT